MNAVDTPSDSSVTDEELTQRWDAGERMADIARAVGITRERVRQRLKRTGRSGPNRNALPSAAAIEAAAREVPSIHALARQLGIATHVLVLALDVRGIRAAVQEILSANRRARADERRLEAQRPYIQRIRRLAHALGHTPTAQELADVGIYHVALHQLFDSVPAAMLAAGLHPNVPGRPPFPLPADFGLELEPTADTRLLRERADVLRRMGIAGAAPAGHVRPRKCAVSSELFYRDPAVVAWVLDAASGVCELCGALGYETDDGSLFLEVHHVVPLSEGGPDVVANAAAVCETCHGRLHRARNRAALRDDLYRDVTRLVPPDGWTPAGAPAPDPHTQSPSA